MSLFGTIQNAGNALAAAQIGLQVTGNNIANANTPGYIRERVVLVPSPTQRYGNLLLGTGVKVHSIVQQIDQFLEEQFRSANSDVASGEIQENTYAQLEGLIGELSDSDLSTSLSKFFNSIHDILNQPGSAGVRNIAVLQGQQLAADIRRLNDKAEQIHEGLNRQVAGQADTINGLLQEIADLNVQISRAEGGDTSPSDAVGLRDRRGNALSELAGLIDIRTTEQPDGSVAVYSSGDFLVFQAIYREVTTVAAENDGLFRTDIHIAATDAPIGTSGGKVAGLVQSRDSIVGNFIRQLNTVASALIQGFNQIYSSGQGNIGFSSLTSGIAPADRDVPLDQAGLGITPVNGSFSLVIKNSLTGETKTTTVSIDLNGLDDDTSLADLTTQLDAIDGITASLTSGGNLRLIADDPNLTFSFASDTSGLLGALGLNGFFTGSSAQDIDIDVTLKADPRRFAASLGGVGEDTENAVRLADFLSTPLSAQNGSTLAQLYDKLVSDTAQGSAAARSATEGFRTFQKTLEGQTLAVSGVSLDEEAIRMISYQRAFQASAKVIATINELFDTLLNL
ncbi:MAG: flagellar hook-associated protein FlgK [Pirellulaceae bacterium]